jgi:ceramide glucosyltransferase
MLPVILSLTFFCTLITLFILNRSIWAHKITLVYNGAYPSISVIRPVKGLDVGAAENFRAALRTGYPGQVETIFILDDENDPAYAVAQQVVDQYRSEGGSDPVKIIFSGPPPQGCTGKLNAMILGEVEASCELVAFADSDTRPDQNVLRILVETLLITPNAGSAFTPVIVDQPVRRSGDVFYALMQNALYAPFALLAAGKGRTLPFIMGQYMVFTRECLTKIGGVACATGQLVDDMAIGKVVHDQGLLNVIAPCSLSIVSSGLSLRAFMPLFKKWLHFAKNGLPFSFLWRQWLFSALFFTPLFALPIAMVLGQWLSAFLCVVDLTLFASGLIWLHEKFGAAKVPLRYYWVPFVILTMAPFIFITNRVSKKVMWRGRVYNVDDRAALN